jgi:hypothetical protein
MRREWELVGNHSRLLPSTLVLTIEHHETADERYSTPATVPHPIEVVSCMGLPNRCRFC